MELQEATEYLVTYYTDLLEAVGLKAEVVVSDDFENNAVYANDVYLGSFHTDYAVSECLASVFRAIADKALVRAVDLDTDAAKAALHDFYGGDL